MNGRYVKTGIVLGSLVALVATGCATGMKMGSGNRPDGDVAGGLMAEVIEGTLAGYKDLTKADRLAIARYLKTIPPIRNKIESKPRK